MRGRRADAAPYDVDVVVIGSGPAGMAAAVQARWMRSPRTVPCSVAVFESGRIGGLAGWRNIINSPIRMLQADFERHHIPVLSERVQRIWRLSSGRFGVEGEQTILRCLSIVIATGLRPLGNEADFIDRGVFTTHTTDESAPRLVDRIESTVGQGDLVVVGNRKSAHIAPMLKGMLPIWVLDGPDLPTLRGQVIPGRLIEVLGGDHPVADADTGGEETDPERGAVDGVAGVRIRWENGIESVIPCRAVLLDDSAFAQAPSVVVDDIALDRIEGGFLAIDAWCRTSVPGVLAAGDITGRGRSITMALGDGVNAGSGASKHVWTRKLGAPRSRFAVTPAFIPVPLAPIEVLMTPLGPSDARRTVIASMDGVADIAALSRSSGLSVEATTAVVEAMLERKLGTVHVRL